MPLLLSSDEKRHTDFLKNDIFDRKRQRTSATTANVRMTSKKTVHPLLTQNAEESRKQLARSKLTCGTRKDLLSAAAVKL